MSQAVDSVKDVEKSQGSFETEQARRKRKKEPITFSDSNSLVTFIIGKEGETIKFTAHKEVVCYRSKTLDAAFNGNFIEGKTQSYRLEDTTEGAFKLFMQWIYRQKFRLNLLDDTCKFDPNSCAQRTELLGLFELWVLADRLCMPSLQNYVIIVLDRIFDNQRIIFKAGCFYVYDNTAIDSPLRRYLVANLGRLTDTVGIFGQPSETWPLQLLIDFADYMLSRDQRVTKRDYDITDFFVRAD